MWILREPSPNFRQEYVIDEQILTCVSTHSLEIFKSNDFEQVALIDKKDLLLKKYLFVHSELLGHIGICTLPLDSHLGLENPNATKSLRVLVYDSFNIEIAFEALKHSDVCVDFVQEDTKCLDSLIDFFEHFSLTRQNPCFRLFENIIDLDITKYDVIISDSKLSAHKIDGLSRMLSERGILLYANKHPMLDMEGFKEGIAQARDFFEVILPFFPSVSILNDKSYVFASRKYHPTSDMVLAKIDFIDALKYYNANVHKQVFALPNFIDSALKNVAKF
ncbi:spermidine synthase [Helicobacter himalayensis]|uniref:spermine/spermidine synthase domain-containing protein n=1 Tax=Helicobacter himalayensis TaxID=1591088 RepID=UPI003D6FACEF